jgi:hypothetical protein
MEKRETQVSFVTEVSLLGSDQLEIEEGDMITMK